MPIKQKKAFALLDILIGLGLGVFVLSGVVALYASYSRFSNSAVQTSNLEYELRTSMALISNDIRRAGYWGNMTGMVGTGANNNPFMVSGVDLSAPSATCILFSYDKNKDGSLPALNAANEDERFGYRLSNSALQSRAATDATFSCAQGTWENLTNSRVEVTNLTFTVTSSTIFVNGVDASDGSMQTRDVAITMTGRLASDTAVQRTLSEVVRVRNDKFIAAP